MTAARPEQSGTRSKVWKMTRHFHGNRSILMKSAGGRRGTDAPLVPGDAPLLCSRDAATLTGQASETTARPQLSLKRAGADVKRRVIRRYTHVNLYSRVFKGQIMSIPACKHPFFFEQMISVAQRFWCFVGESAQRGRNFVCKKTRRTESRWSSSRFPASSSFSRHVAETALALFSGTQFYFEFYLVVIICIVGENKENKVHEYVPVNWILSVQAELGTRVSCLPACNNDAVCVEQFPL